jgi:hypothetical protein
MDVRDLLVINLLKHINLRKMYNVKNACYSSGYKPMKSQGRVYFCGINM